MATTTITSTAEATGTADAVPTDTGHRPVFTSGVFTSGVFTSGGVSYETLAAVATRLAILAVEDTLNGPSEERTVERTTLVEHLMWFANVHGSTRPAAALRHAMASMQFANGTPGTPVLSVLEELQIATSRTQ